MIVLALAACYVACTIANWGASTHTLDDMSKPLAGRASMWMQIVAQWPCFSYTSGRSWCRCSSRRETGFPDTGYL